MKYKISMIVEYSQVTTSNRVVNDVRWILGTYLIKTEAIEVNEFKVSEDGKNDKPHS